MTIGLIQSASVLALLGGLISAPAIGQSVSPVRLDVQLKVQDGCNINGGQQNPQALLNFGTVSNAAGTVVDIDGSTQVADGGTAFSVTCNVPTDQVSVTVEGGQNAVAGVRGLADQNVPGTIVPYRLYVNSGRTFELEIGNAQALSEFAAASRRLSNQTDVQIYGRILAADVQVPPGRYTDQVDVFVTF